LTEFQVKTGDYCASIASQNGISLNDFYFLNPEIQTNCYNLEIGQGYCVQWVGTITTYSGYSTFTVPSITQISTIAAPSTTQTSTSAAPSTTPASTSAPSSTTQTSTNATPSTMQTTSSAAPMQTGLSKSCTKLYTVAAGASCAGIEQQFNVTFNQLLQWNPAIGTNCESLWVGFAVCVAASS